MGTKRQFLSKEISEKFPFGIQETQEITGTQRDWTAFSFVERNKLLSRRRATRRTTTATTKEGLIAVISKVLNQT